MLKECITKKQIQNRVEVKNRIKFITQIGNQHRKAQLNWSVFKFAVLQQLLSYIQHSVVEWIHTLESHCRVTK